jgi:hypothetical protein
MNTNTTLFLCGGEAEGRGYSPQLSYSQLKVICKSGGPVHLKLIRQPFL